MKKKPNIALFIITAVLTTGTLVATVGRHRHCGENYRHQACDNRHHTGCSDTRMDKTGTEQQTVQPK